MNKIYNIFFKQLLISLSIFCFSFLLHENFNFFKKLSFKLDDINHKIKYYIFQSKPCKGKNAVLILLDPKTDREIGCRFPFPRDIIAELIEKVHKQNPKLFAMDFTFMGVSKDKEIDIKLSNSFKENDVVLFTFVQDDGRVFKIPKIFKESANDIGILSKNLDLDNVIRSITAFSCDLDTFENYYSAELLLSLNYYGLNSSVIEQDVINNKLIFNTPFSPIKNIYYGNSKRIDFKNYFKLNDLTTVSFIDVLRGKIPNNLFSDKIVLLGAKSEIYHDQHISPLGMELGVVIVYNSLLTFINNEFLDMLNPIIEYFSYFSIILIYIVLIYQRNFKDALFLTTIYLLLILITGYLFFENNLIWHSFSSLFSIIIFFIYKQSKEFIKIWRSNEKIKNSIILDSKTGFFSYPYFLSKYNSELTNNTKSIIAALEIKTIYRYKNVLDDPEGRNNLIKIGNIIRQFLKKNGYFCFDKKTFLFYFVFKIGTLKSEITKFNHLIDLLSKNSTLNKNDINIVYISPLDLINPKIFTMLECLNSYIKADYNKENNLRHVPLTYYEQISNNIQNLSQDLKILDNDDFLSKQILTYQESISNMHDKLKLTSKEIEISRKLSSLGKIAAEVAHELKNPLQNLLYMCEFLNRYVESDHKAHKYVELLKNETNRMTKLCHSMLDFSKVKETAYTKLNINQIIIETLEFMSGTFLKKHVNVVSNLDKNIPLILGDSDKLKQVFLNLFINAVDAMIDPGELYVETICELHIIQIKIKDNGMGIPQENIDKIFNIFFSTKGEKGTGLGLSTCFTIIKNHNGKINVESEVGFGTTFTILFSF